MVKKVGSRMLLLVAMVCGLILSGMFGFGIQSVRAAPEQLASGEAAPAQGTANSLNLTFQAQDWIGFYGNLTMQIVANGTPGNYSLLNVSVNKGTMYITKAGGKPSFLLPDIG